MRRLLFLLWLTLSAAAAATRNQTITLEPGWNAVWLEVQPEAADGTPARPEHVFAAIPQVSAAARFLPARAPLQFLQDPATESLGADFWLKWRRSTVIGGNTLGGLPGNTAYLIENSSSAPVTFTLTGKVGFHRYQWVPDSYNLFGLPLENATAPTFSHFFSPSPAHPLQQIFKLSAGRWVTVQPNERLRQNTAYWVYSKGGSSYQGPVPVLFPDAGGFIEFGEALTSLDLSAGNLAPTPSRLNLFRLVDQGLGLFDARGGSGIVNFDVTADGTGAGTLAASTSATLRLEARRPWTALPALRENLYQVKTILSGGSSFYQYLPVRAARDLAAAAGGSSPQPGLWVGDVVLTHATSLVSGKTSTGTQSGPRLEPVKRPLRYRVILHVDAAGQARLLGHATLMKKQRPSPDLPEEMVVVVDDTKIPGFIGIEERGGKLTGKRFDTAAYDLPRRVIPPAAEDNNPNFNPGTLDPAYLLTLPLSGALSPGGVVENPSGSFILDPWHRTHPFRHAYHPDHRKGFRISRSMRWQVDAAGSPEAAKTPGFGTTALSGIFEESLTGLMKPGDVHRSRGRFLLQRLSEVAELQ